MIAFQATYAIVQESDEDDVVRAYTPGGEGAPTLTCIARTQG